MSQIHEAEEVIGAVAMFLSSYGPQSADVQRIAKAVEPIAVWHQEYTAWKKQRDGKEMILKFRATHR